MANLRASLEESRTALPTVKKLDEFDELKATFGTFPDEERYEAQVMAGEELLKLKATAGGYIEDFYYYVNATGRTAKEFAVTEDEFRTCVADASHIKQAFEAYEWLRNEHEEGVELYNQLLREKEAVDEDNSRLREERDEQKERVLRMEGALTYVERQVAELQAKQQRQPTPPPPPSDQATNSNTRQVTPPPVTPPPATPSESTSTGEGKKIVVVPDPPIFNGDVKEKETSYDHRLLQMRNKMTANERMMPTELLKMALGFKLKSKDASHLANSSPLGRSQFNATNVAVVIDLALKMINARVLKPEDITVLICYRAQWKVYRTKLMGLYAEQPQLEHIHLNVRTSDAMQGSQAPFVIFHVVAANGIGSMRQLPS
ncbi:hypothetical protein MMC22_003878 [Lobaria immixta]|nr:hypothetical protein [Lobaria immixta]